MSTMAAPDDDAFPRTPAGMTEQLKWEAIERLMVRMYSDQQRFATASLEFIDQQLAERIWKNRTADNIRHRTRQFAVLFFPNQQAFLA